MSRENVEVVRQAVEAFNTEGPDAARPFYDANVEYREDPKFPEARVYHGIDPVLDQFNEFGAAFDEYRFEIEDILEVDERIVLVVREEALGKASGVKIDRQTGWVATLRAGRIVRLEIFLDPKDALEAAGFSE